MTESFPADPWEYLDEWLPANDEPARPTMTLATVDAEGRPDARTLLRSEYDAHGFYFHTDAASRKVEQLAAHPEVALMLHLPAQLHQLTVQGVAEPADRVELDRVYAARSPYLRQLAYQNTHEFAALPQSTRLELWAEFQADHDVAGIDPPQGWAGYLVRPTRLTFWFGNPDTASRRVEYSRTSVADTEWVVELRAG